MQRRDFLYRMAGLVVPLLALSACGRAGKPRRPADSPPPNRYPNVTFPNAPQPPADSPSEDEDP